MIFADIAAKLRARSGKVKGRSVTATNLRRPARRPMMDRMRIYTKTGDDGTTGLPGGSRVRKDDPRIECCGTIDELNAAMGLAAVVATPELREQLQRVQSDLFVIGSHLAAPGGSRQQAALPPLDPEMTARLESQIDAADAQLPPLRNFILPGGAETAARLHLARAVCRRAERLLVAHALNSSISSVVLAYLNRLSDWAFVQARLANQMSGVNDIPWSAH
jgi:cob(I)alamin adenosyltransferase